MYPIPWPPGLRCVLTALLLLPMLLTFGPVARGEQPSGVWIDELVLEAVKPPYRLADALIVLQEDSRFYLPLTQISNLLSFATDSEIARGRAGGWALEPAQNFLLDIPAGTVTVKGKTRALAPGEVMDAASYGPAAADLYISTALAAEIWPVSFTVDFSNLRLEIASARPLPFEARLAREQKRAAAPRPQPPAYDPALPFRPNPYRLFSLPAIDLETRYSWDGGKDTVSGENSVSAVMDLLGFSTRISAIAGTVDRHFKRPEKIRITGTRKAFGEDDLFLGFREMQAGDTRLAPRALVGPTIGGRGAVLTTRQVERNQDFDLITVEGQGQAGWEAELYRNNELLDYGYVDSLGRYIFENVQLLTGNNTIRVVLYGPQGQVEERAENYMIGNMMARPGAFEYEIGMVDSGRDTLLLDMREPLVPEGAAMTAYAAYGLNRRLTLFGSAARVPAPAGRGGPRAYAGAGAAFTAGGGLMQMELLAGGGGTALDARFAGAFFGVRVNAQQAFFRNFESPAAGYGAFAKRSESTLTLHKNLRGAAGSFGLQLGLNNRHFVNGDQRSEISTRQSWGQGQVRLTHETASVLRNFHHESTQGQISAATRIGAINLRGLVSYRLYPDALLQMAQAEARSFAATGFSAGLALRHDFDRAATGINGQVGYNFDKLLTALELDWLEERGLQVVLRASTALGPYGRNGAYIMSGEKLTTARPVQARFFVDHDADNVFGPGDVPVPDMRLRTGRRASSALSDEDGYVTPRHAGSLDGILSVRPDPDSLADPYLVPATGGYNVLAREGTVVFADLPLIPTGAIDGIVRHASGQPATGITLELADDRQNVLMTTQTAYDGYYIFEYIPPGLYEIRGTGAAQGTLPPLKVRLGGDDPFRFGTDLILPAAPAAPETLY